jgi:hypothetical protein
MVFLVVIPLEADRVDFVERVTTDWAKRAVLEVDEGRAVDETV